MTRPCPIARTRTRGGPDGDRPSRGKRPREHNRRAQVHREDRVELSRRERAQMTGRRQRRIRDQDVDLAGGGDEPLELLGVREVADDRTPANARREPLELFDPATGEHESGTASGERSRDRPPNAAGGARQQNAAIDQAPLRRSHSGETILRPGAEVILPRVPSRGDRAVRPHRRREDGGRDRARPAPSGTRASDPPRCPPTPCRSTRVSRS